MGNNYVNELRSLIESGKSYNEIINLLEEFELEINGSENKFTVQGDRTDFRVYFSDEFLRELIKKFKDFLTRFENHYKKEYESSNNQKFVPLMNMIKNFVKLDYSSPDIIGPYFGIGYKYSSDYVFVIQFISDDQKFKFCAEIPIRKNYQDLDKKELLGKIKQSFKEGDRQETLNLWIGDYSKTIKFYSSPNSGFLNNFLLM